MTRLVFALALMGSLTTAAQAEDVENLPASIAAKGSAPVAQLQAAGAQIYICAKNAAGALNWTFREPLATLLEEGKTVGRHFVGPTWEFVDGSRVVGEVVSKAPGTTAKDIPWLKLSVKEPPKSGLVAGATSVLRIDTKGGVFEGACDSEGELHSEPYSATYIFAK
ncbi:MAG TPA: DUF3455 domain-containing protein [Roseiarcus sp.]